MNENFCKSIADAVSSKKVVIYGAGYLGAMMLNIMDELGKEVLFFLDQNSDKQKNGFCGYEVKAPEDIVYEKLSEIIVVVAVGVKNDAENILRGLGLREGVDFIHSAVMRYETCDAVDPFLGYSRSNDIRGFKAVGDYDEKKHNVICLGGSTTDYSQYGFKSWPEYLSELFENDNISLNVLNGGVIGYSSSQELLKLIRDGLELCPSLVISYSGVNDLGDEPILGNGYLYQMWEKMEDVIVENGSKSIWSADRLSVSYGTKSNLDSAEYWYRNEMMMCNICRGFSIPFLGILQPSTYTKSDTKRSLYEQRTIREVKNKEQIEEQFRKAKQLVNAGQEKNIVDFTALFNECENIYVDIAHVFEQGNKVIADAIYQTIKDKQLLNI